MSSGHGRQTSSRLHSNKLLTAVGFAAGLAQISSSTDLDSGTYQGADVGPHRQVKTRFRLDHQGRWDYTRGPQTISRIFNKLTGWRLDRLVWAYRLTLHHLDVTAGSAD